MAIKSDYHMHTSFSGDSTAPMEEMILKGIELGLDSICFTEHMDIDFVYEKPEEKGMFELNTDSYLYDFIKYKEKYADKIQLLFGVELGVQPHLKRELSLYAKSFDFDFIIASSHICNKKDPGYASFYEGRPQEEAYREYFLSILDNLKTFNNFDVYGHLDYVVRYGPTKNQHYHWSQYQDIIDEILKYLIEHGKGIEINTAGFHYGLNHPNPTEEIIARYRALGGEIITIGADAHKPEHVAYDFQKVPALLKHAGFQYYTVFRERKPEFIRLP